MQRDLHLPRGSHHRKFYLHWWHQKRIGLAMGGMQKLTSIWKSKEITTKTKIELYRVLILSIATYGSESWTLKKRYESNRLTGVWTQIFLKHIDCCNFQIITEMYIKVYFSGMEMSQWIHFWYQILLKMMIFWENGKKPLFLSKIFVTS